MLALLQFLEANQRKHYGNGNNDDLNSLDYQKPYNGPYGGNFAAAKNMNNGDNDDGDDDFDVGVNNGEWWNEWIEPSVQYYGGARNHFNDENTRKRLTTLPGKLKCSFRLSHLLIKLYDTQRVPLSGGFYLNMSMEYTKNTKNRKKNTK